VQNVGGNVLWQQALRWLQLLTDRRRRADHLVQPAESWEAQYAAGRWDCLGELSELARFSVLAGYVCHLKPGGAVLDVGCGQGNLLRRLPSSCYSRYVGIDLSASAIAVAQKQQNERSVFFVADCEHYSPAERFDVIVFNEVLCCLHDPVQAVARYARSLNPGGLILMSNCLAARGSATILSRLRLLYPTLDEVRILHSERNITWVCTALRPADERSQSP
jgi:2-polyprenyl-3-methyl-5-hydroxy-6-metoxy-1,4-benzoquinol methylase